MTPQVSGISGFWFVDEQGLTTHIDDALLQALGLQQQQLQGRTPDAGLTLAQAPAQRQLPHPSLARLAGLLSAGQAVNTHLALPQLEASAWQAEVSLSPLPGGAGQVMHWRLSALMRPTSDAAFDPLAVMAPHGLNPTAATWRQAFDAITDMVSVVGEDEVYRVANAAWCRMMKLSAAQVEGHHTEQIFPRGFLQSPQRKAFHGCLVENKPISLLNERHFPDGRRMVVESTYYPFGRDHSGQRCVVVVSRDVTERDDQHRDLLETTQLLLRTLDATGEAIMAASAGQTEIPARFVNPQLLRMWGLSESEGQQLTPKRLLAHATPLFANPELELSRIKSILEQNLDADDRVLLRDGRVLLRRCRYGVLPEPGEAVRVWSFRDITLEARAEEAARQHESEMYALLDAFPGHIAVIDEHLKYRFVNVAFAAALGLKPAEVNGRLLVDVLDAEQAAAVQGYLQQAQPGAPVEYDRKLGKRLFRVRLVHGAHARIGTPRWYAFGLDVTNARLSERAQQAHATQIRALLDAFPGYISATDESFRYTYVNQRLAQAIGRTPEALLGTLLVDTVGPERMAVIKQDLQRALHDEAAVVDESHYPASAQRAALDLRVTQVCGAPDAQGRRQYYAFGEDITERKRTERALISAHQEAERANQAKSQFLSHMSHELRTPLNAILGFAQLLQADPALQNSPQQGQQLAEILRGGRHLLHLINDVLDLGRVEAGKLDMRIEDVALRPLLAQCLTLMQPVAAERGVHLVPLQGAEPAAGAETAAPDSAGLHARCDPVRLQQVLLNLLGNAIKYNRPEGQVQLQLSAEAERVRIVVRDSGEGLSAMQQERLFQPFERLHRPHERVEGAGIGLALSRQLMLAMHGDIGVLSEVGTGSQFWIELPLAAGSAAALAGAAESTNATNATTAATTAKGLPAPAQTRLRQVLYIEDNPVNVVLMEAMLARLDGLAMVSEVLPLPGIERARHLLPDLILLDIQLPGMTGFEVLQILKQDPRTRHIPVVAVSANAMDGDIAAGHEAGFSDYITKPLELATLLKVVQSQLWPAAPDSA